MAKAGCVVPSLTRIAISPVSPSVSITCEIDASSSARARLAMACRTASGSSVDVMSPAVS